MGSAGLDLLRIKNFGHIDLMRYLHILFFFNHRACLSFHFSCCIPNNAYFDGQRMDSDKVLLKYINLKKSWCQIE